ncbi:hypothetical protein SRHO_G00305610 [Serrasalmus rhombeus]
MFSCVRVLLSVLFFPLVQVELRAEGARGAFPPRVEGANRGSKRRQQAKKKERKKEEKRIVFSLREQMCNEAFSQDISLPQKSNFKSWRTPPHHKSHPPSPLLCRCLSCIQHLLIPRHQGEGHRNSWM